MKILFINQNQTIEISLGNKDQFLYCASKCGMILKHIVKFLPSILSVTLVLI